MTSKWRERRTGLLAVLLFLSAAATSQAATITVTTLADGVAEDGKVSLREALESINGASSVNADVVPEGQPYGTDDMIDLTGVGGAILLNGELTATSSVRIVGPGADVLAINAQLQSRVFHAPVSGTHLELQQLAIGGGRVTSEDVARGGAILAPQLTLTDCVVAENLVIGPSALGGGIFAEVLTLRRSRVANNAAISNATSWTGMAMGGGVVAGTLEMVGSTIANNSLDSMDTTIEGVAFFGGGGIMLWSEAPVPSTISGSTIHNNSASVWGIGGGVAALFGSTAMTNSTFFGNTAGVGGAIYANHSTVTALHLTIAGNESPNGAAIYVDSENTTMTLAASIVATNVFPSDGLREIAVWDGQLLSNGYNFLGSEPLLREGGFGDIALWPSDQIATGFAGLTALAPNGGFPDTMAISPDSTALDAIPAEHCRLTEDQRSFVRPSGTGCDIGAYEADLAVFEGLVYYDADLDGLRDDGEVGIAGWRVDLIKVVGGQTTTVTTRADGTFVARFAVGDEFIVRQRSPSDLGWIQTGNIESQSNSCNVRLNDDMSYSVGAFYDVTYGDLNFGNVCLGGAGAKGVSFWTTKNGGKLVAADDIAMLATLNLRNAKGNAYDPGNASQLKSFLSGASTTNMAYALSAELAALKLDILNGFVDGTQMVRALGPNSANALGYASINALLAEADAELAQHGKTLVGSPFRAYQEVLKDLLAEVNQSKKVVVQPAPSCPAPF